MKYEVGDRVKVAKIVETSDTLDAIDAMYEDYGKIATIIELDTSDNTCVLNVDNGTQGYWWELSWIEPIEPNIATNEPIRVKVAVKFYNEITENHDTIRGVVLRDTFDGLARWVFEDTNGNLYVINYDAIDYVLPYEEVNES